MLKIREEMLEEVTDFTEMMLENPSEEDGEDGSFNGAVAMLVTAYHQGHAELAALRDSQKELVAAAENVFSGLNAKIDYAVKYEKPVPVFYGIAELSAALEKLKP